MRLTRHTLKRIIHDVVKENCQRHVRQADVGTAMVVPRFRDDAVSHFRRWRRDMRFISSVPPLSDTQKWTETDSDFSERTRDPAHKSFPS